MHAVGQLECILLMRLSGLTRSMLTWLDILAVRLNIRPASFCQKHIVPEVIHLHLLKVEDFVLAFLHHDNQ